MHGFYCDDFVLPLPATHRFPQDKYRSVREAVTRQGWIDSSDLHVPEAASGEELLRVHAESYWWRVVRGTLSCEELRRLGLPWSPILVERARRSVGATLAACRVALTEGCAVNLGGGTHHAFVDRGEGFCVFNDAAVALRTLQHEKQIRRALVIDCDVHQGNGTAAIFAGDSSVFTLSVHGERNYPLRKELSNLDVGLADGTEDDAYLAALAHSLDRALPAAGADFALYVSGADPHWNDRLGRLGLRRDGLRLRDRLVMARCRQAGLPLAVVLGGGYGRAMETTVAVHEATVAEARRCWDNWREQERGAGAISAKRPSF
jgi:acetoin utilization deacetylase AcuC-like enzyme